MSFERTRLSVCGRIACAAALACSLTAGAQTAIPPASGVDPSMRFEVVSIRPHNEADGMTSLRMNDDSYVAMGASLGSLVKSAYGAEDWWQMDMPGMPSSLREARYDIQAKIDPDSAARLKAMKREDRIAQNTIMMRSMLEERFHLKAHNVMKDATIYSLVPAKGGAKLKESAPPPIDPDAPKGQARPRGMMRIGMGNMTAQEIGLDQLASSLSGQLHQKVINATGLTGKYDFTLKWNGHEQFGGADSGGDNDSSPSLYTALEEQLGLELKPTHGQVKSVVIDHIEPPSEN